MRWENCGPELLILRDLNVPAHVLAQHLNHQQIPGLREAVAAFDTVGLHIDSSSFDRSVIERSPDSIDPVHSIQFQIPVCYELGLDFESACTELGLSASEFIRLHTSAVFTCAAIGFCPGFPYLTGLPPELSGLARLSSPRTQVPKGSVAITGAQCGIYPDVTPGGWRLIGSTPVVICDVDSLFFPIQAGDSIRFHAISPAEHEEQIGQRLAAP